MDKEYIFDETCEIKATKQTSIIHIAMCYLEGELLLEMQYPSKLFNIESQKKFRIVVDLDVENEYLSEKSSFAGRVTWDLGEISDSSQLSVFSMGGLIGKIKLRKLPMDKIDHARIYFI